MWECTRTCMRAGMHGACVCVRACVRMCLCVCACVLKLMCKSLGQHLQGESVRELYGNSREADLGSKVKRRILVDTYTLSAGYYAG